MMLFRALFLAAALPAFTANAAFAADPATVEETVKAAEPFGCLNQWTIEQVSDSVFMVTGTEKFLACYRKGDYGADTANRHIPSGTQTVYRVECEGETCAVTCRSDVDGTCSP